MPFPVIFLLLAALANVGFFLPELPEAGKEAASIPGSDKIVHVAVFTLTAWAIARVWAVSSRDNATGTRSILIRKLWVVAAALVAWALFIEVVQSFYPARSADPVDVLADCMGLIAGLGGVVLELRLSNRMHNHQKNPHPGS